MASSSSSTSASTSTTKTTTAAPLNLTTGVEIEHILVIRQPATPLIPSDTEAYDSASRDPLPYLQAQFAAHSLDSFVSNAAKAIDFDYRTWLITTDGSLNSFNPPEALQAALPGKIHSSNKGEWTDHGVELVSPPMLAPSVSSPVPAVQQEGLCQLKLYLDVMHHSPKHGAFITPQCGLHVHVGLAPDAAYPNGRDIPLPVLQHLAYLLLKYEGVVSSLHHHSRTPLPGTQAATYARSNRISFLSSRHSEGCGTEGSKVDLAEVKRRVFREGMTVKWLAWMMGADEMLDEEGQMVDYAGSRSGVHGWEDQGRWEDGEGGGDALEVVPWGQGPEALIMADTAATASWSSSFGASWEGPALTTTNGEEEGTPATSISDSLPTPTTAIPSPSPPTEEPQYYPTGTRYKISRWDLLPSHERDGPRTIEFRQAAGSVDAEEIAETVRLYVAVVRCAERRANMDLAAGTPVGQCLLSSSEDASEATISSFLQLLQLPEKFRGYWTSRATRLQESAVLGLRDPNTMKSHEKCSVCCARHTKRKEARQASLQRTKGWMAFLPGASRSKARKAWAKHTVQGKWEKPAKPWLTEVVEDPDSWIPKIHTEKRDWEGKPVRRAGGKGKGKKETFTRKEKCEAKRKVRAKTARRAKQCKEDQLAAARLKRPGVPDWDLQFQNEQVAEWRDAVEVNSSDRIVVAEFVSEPFDPNYVPAGGW